MPSMIRSAAGLLAAASTVFAHGHVTGIVADGVYAEGFQLADAYSSSPPARVGWTEAALDNGFVAPDAYATGDIICHKSATNALLSASVTAGSDVTIEWDTWPESHHGPVINYMADCGGDCTTVDKTTLLWFKIAESGMTSDGTVSPGTWASDALIANNFSQSVTIPSTIAAGNYVLRHEIIALHSAGSADGAQNYPQCVNLVVASSGTDTPEGVLGTALYTETDPGILFDLYTTPLTYTIPGPALYSGGSSSGTVASSAAAAPAVSTAAAVSSAAPTTMVTSVKPAATSAVATSVVEASATPTATAEATTEEEDDTCE